MRRWALALLLGCARPSTDTDVDREHETDTLATAATLPAAPRRQALDGWLRVRGVVDEAVVDFRASGANLPVQVEPARWMVASLDLPDGDVTSDTDGGSVDSPALDALDALGVTVGLPFVYPESEPDPLPALREALSLAGLEGVQTDSSPCDHLEDAWPRALHVTVQHPAGSTFATLRPWPYEVDLPGIAAVVNAVQRTEGGLDRLVVHHGDERYRLVRGRPQDLQELVARGVIRTAERPLAELAAIVEHADDGGLDTGSVP